MRFHRDILNIDAAAEAARIEGCIQNYVRRFRKSGAVVGISGGIDSAVVLTLCVRALGPGRVTALMMPERDSDPESVRLAELLARHLGVRPILEDITPVLDGFGCYPRRDRAIQRLFPSFDATEGYKVKIVLPPNLLDDDRLNIFSATVIAPDGTEESKPLPAREFLEIVAASNFKQRTRMTMLYYHAELRNAAVIGTANKNEHDQGFFVKYGDSGVDLKAIAHLYKTQVYQLARSLGVPEEIQQRPPTTDTYSAGSTQEEFFFRLPFATMDLLCYAQEHGVTPEEAGMIMGLTPIQVTRAFREFDRKRRGTDYLRATPLEVIDEHEDASTAQANTSGRHPCAGLSHEPAGIISGAASGLAG